MSELSFNSSVNSNADALRSAGGEAQTGVANLADSISALRDRVAGISSLELNDHCNEYDAIHTQLESALSRIDVN